MNEPSTDQKIRKKLSDQLGKVDSLASLRKFLNSLSSDDVQIEYKMEFARWAFRHAISLTRDSQTDAETVITSYLIPICVGEWEGDSIGKHRMREILRDWLDGLPTKEMVAIRNNVLSILVAHFQQHDSKDALWTISMIGYRTEAVKQLLWKVHRGQDKESSDVAGQILVNLGLGIDEKQRLLDTASRRSRNGDDSRFVLVVIQELFDNQHIADAFRLLEKTSKDNSDSGFKFSVAASAVTRALSRVPKDSPAHDRCWEIFRVHRDEIQMMQGLANSCNSTQVVSDHVDWLLADKGDNEIRLYRLLSSLENLCEPNHIKGWRSIDKPPFAELISKLARKDAQHDGKFLTTKHRIKKGAWEVALISGCVVDEWVDKALLEESSPETINSIAGYVACFGVEQLTDTFLKQISLKRSVKKNASDDELFFEKSGLMQVAASCADWASFEALTNFSLTHEGNVLLSTISEIKSVALVQLKERRGDVLRHLNQCAAKATSKHQKEAAISVLCELVKSGEIRASEIDGLWSFVEDSALYEYCRRDAIEAFGFSDVQLDDSQRDYLIGMARNSDEDLGWTCLETSLNLEIVEPHEHWVENRIGVQHEAGVATLEQGSFSAWQARLLAVLFERSPERYALAISQLIEKAAIDVLYQIFGFLGQWTPDDVSESLQQRILQINSRAMAETAIFNVLGEIAPRKLADLAEFDSIKNWLVEARVALCEAIRKRPELSPNDRIDCFKTFANDAAFQVRRSAYRAIAELLPHELLQLCNSWSGTKETEMRKRAAEAIAWIPEALLAKIAPDHFGLASDPERQVRMRHTECQKRKQDRMLAKNYASIIEAGCKLGGRDVSWYPYAKALSRKGDDDSIRHLEAIKNSTYLYPNVTFCLEKVSKELQNNWNQETEKWPEPWSHQAGYIEKFRGELEFSNGKRAGAEILLWCKHRTSQTDLGEWGGVADQIEGSTLGLFGSNELTVHIAGRKAFSAMIFQSKSGAHGNRIVFRSNESFPVQTPVIKDVADLFDDIARVLSTPAFTFAKDEIEMLSNDLRTLAETWEWNLDRNRHKRRVLSSISLQVAEELSKRFIDSPNRILATFQLISLICERSGYLFRPYFADFCKKLIEIGPEPLSNEFRSNWEMQFPKQLVKSGRLLPNVSKDKSVSKSEVKQAD